MRFHLNDEDPIPGLAEKVARQRAEGGRLVMYVRVWSAFVVSMTQRRIEWVPYAGSRMLPGLKHSLFSMLLGIWGINLVVLVPYTLIVNFRGGIDVTAQYSDRPIDPFSSLPPNGEQATRELQAAQWTFVALGILVVIALLCFAFREGI